MSSFSFRWLHISDLHFGMKGQAPLWANLKHHLFDDLPLLHDQAGPFDLVVFSGDIAQIGSPEEFNGATDALSDIYGRLTDLGSTPFFVAVPGNHDLVRFMFRLDDVVAFSSTYMPVSEIWMKRGRQLSTINPWLRSHGLEPAFPPAELRCTFYRRAEVTPLLDRLQKTPTIPEPEEVHHAR